MDTYKKGVLLFCSVLMAAISVSAENVTDNPSPVDYVSTLVGTHSKRELSTGNTYPAVAMPWGMNF